MKAIIVGGGLLLATTPASAMTEQEFLQVYDKSARMIGLPFLKAARAPVCQGEGYHSVPDWLDLGEEARALILKKGYRDEDIVEIAREAAIANGMSK